MSFDPTNNAAVLAALVVRADYGQFEILEDDATKLFDAGHVMQPLFPIRMFSPIALSWRATYRGIRYGYEAMPPNGNPLNADKPLIVPFASKARGIACVLTSAGNFFDGLDRMAMTMGANPNPYRPTY